MILPVRLSVRLSVTGVDQSPRKLSYRKGDRAMRTIYDALKNFESPRVYAHGYFPRNFNGLLFRSIL